MSSPTVHSSLTVHRYGNREATAVVLVHGLTEAGTAWPDLVRHWGDRWDLHAPDLRGHGRSPRFTAAELTAVPDVFHADLLALVDELTGPVVLVGHSLGGLLSLRVALARPDRIAALVLEDPARPRGDVPDPALVAVPDPAFVAEIEAFLDSMADIEGQVARMGRETSWSREEIEEWAACKPLVDREYVRCGLGLGDPAWEELFDAVAVPTLLVLPPDAPMAPDPARFDNALVRTVVVPDSGHCVRRDQPALFHAAVDRFLTETLA